MTKTNKILGFKDVAVLTFISNFGIRWFAVAAALGASSIFFWIIGAIFFFLPLTFMSAHLSKLYPEEGGIYAWVRHSLGDRSAFVVAWLYWITNIFFYPAILIFLATNLAYLLGNPELANNNVFICTTVIVSFWIIIFISLFGLKANKLLTEYGGTLGTILPTLFLILLGFLVLFLTHHSATIINFHTVLPNGAVMHSLANLSIIMFAMTGIEIIPTFANVVKNPKKDLYFGLLLGAISIVACYILGTVAMNIVLSPSEVQNTSGLIHTFDLIANKLHIPWMTRYMAFLLIFSEFAAVSIWLIATITIFFKCTQKGLLPQWCQKTNQHNAPSNALWFVGVLVTLIVLFTNFLPEVSNIYELLILVSAVLYFVPYLFLVLTYVKNIKKLPHSPILPWCFAFFVFVSLILGILFSFQPPAGMSAKSEILYEVELIFLISFFIIVGYIVYEKRKKYIE